MADPIEIPIPSLQRPSKQPIEIPLAPSGNEKPLENRPDDTLGSGMTKNAGTAAIKGTTHIPGFAGDLSDMTRYILQRIHSGVTGTPMEELDQRHQDFLNRKSDFERRNFGFQMPSLPSGHDIAAPILERTGEYQPTTPEGRLGAAGIEGGLAMLGPGALSHGIKVADQGANALRIAREMMKGGAKAVPGGAAAGVVGDEATQITGDPLAGMLASSLLPTAAVGAKHVAREAVAPFVPSMRQSAADRRLTSMASKPQKALDTLEQRPHQSGETLGEATLDPGILQAEKAADNTSPSFQEKTANRIAARNDERVSSIDSLAPDADQMSPSKQFRKHLDDIDAMTQDTIDQATARAKAAEAQHVAVRDTAVPAGDPMAVQRRAAQRVASIDEVAQQTVEGAQKAKEAAHGVLPPGSTMDATGDVLQGIAAEADKAKGAAITKLYNAIDPDGKLHVVTTGPAAAAQKMKKDINPAVELPSSIAAPVLDMVANLKPVTSFKDLMKLDKTITAKMAEAAGGPNPDRIGHAQLVQLKGHVMDAIDNALENQHAWEQAAVARGDMIGEATLGAKLAEQARQFAAERKAGRSAGQGAVDLGAVGQAGVSRPSGGSGQARGQSGVPESPPGAPANVTQPLKTGPGGYVEEPFPVGAKASDFSAHEYLGFRGEKDLRAEAQETQVVSEVAKSLQKAMGLKSKGGSKWSKYAVAPDGAEIRVSNHQGFNAGSKALNEQTASSIKIDRGAEELTIDSPAIRAAHGREVTFPMNESTFGRLSSPEAIANLRALIETGHLRQPAPPSKPAVKSVAPGEPNFDADAAARLGEAKAAHKERATTFRDGPVGKALETNGYAGQFTQHAAKVPAAAFPKGDIGGHNVRAWLRAGQDNPGTIPALQEVAISRLREAMKGGDLTPKTLDAWKREYGPALRALDEAAPGSNFLSKFDTAAKATEHLETQAAVAKDAMRAARETATAKFMGLTQPAEVGNALMGMVRSKTGPTQLAEVMSKMDQAGIEGARDGLYRTLIRDHMNPDGTLATARYRKFVNDNRSALEPVFGASGINKLLGVAHTGMAARAAVEAVERATADRAIALKQAQQGVAAKFLKLTDPTEVGDTLMGMVKARNGPTQLAELWGKMDADAQAGAKRALTDAILRDHQVASRDMSAPGLRRFVDENKASLEHVYGSGGTEVLTRIADDAARYSKALSMQKAPAGSDSFRNMARYLKEKGAGHLTDLTLGGALLMGVMEGFQHQDFGHLIVASTAATAKALYSTMRSRGVHKINDMVELGLTNPEVGAAMMRRAIDDKGQFRAESLQALNKAIIRATAQRETLEDHSRIGRKAGGRVGFDAAAKARDMLAMLEKAKKQHERQTKPLLNVPDEAVAHALKVANRAAGGSIA